MPSLLNLQNRRKRLRRKLHVLLVSRQSKRKKAEMPPPALARSVPPRQLTETYRPQVQKRIRWRFLQNLWSKRRPPNGISKKTRRLSWKLRPLLGLRLQLHLQHLRRFLLLRQ